MADTAHLCAVCPEPGSLCAKCSNIRYCSRLCQEADWHSHKLVCKSFRRFGDDSRPNPSARRGIFFPVETKVPRFIWLGEPGYSQSGLANPRALLGDDDPAEGTMLVTQNVQLDRILDRVIRISMRDSFGVDGSAFNMSLLWATRGAPMNLDWNGPIVATGQRRAVDLDTTDFKMLLDWFKVYGADDVRTYFHSACVKAKGVLVYAPSDSKRLGKPAFEAVEVPMTHPVFYGHTSALASPQIAEMIELPLFARKVTPGTQQLKDDNYSGANQTATYLHLRTRDEPGSETGEDVGWAPMYWQNDVGTVLVVRQDKQPLSPKDLEVLCHWCRFKLSPLFEDGSELNYAETGGETRDHRVEIVNQITKANFETYKEEFLKGGKA